MTKFINQISRHIPIFISKIKKGILYNQSRITRTFYSISVVRSKHFGDLKNCGLKFYEDGELLLTSDKIPSANRTDVQ